MPLLGLVNCFVKQRRACPSGVTDRIAFELEPRAQKLDLGRTADAVRPLDCDQMAGEPPLREVWHPASVPGFTVIGSKRHDSPSHAADRNREVFPGPSAARSSADWEYRRQPQSYGNRIQQSVGRKYLARGSET